MHVLSFTPRRGAQDSDSFPALVEALGGLGLRREPERTAGSDALALADRAGTALAAVLRASELGSWSIGWGIGAVPDPLPTPTRAITGPAVEAAARAVHAARTTSQVPLAIRAADPRQQDTAADAEAVLRLVGWMIATRNRGQWRVVHALREQPEATQAQLAERLGITQQSVSRSLKTSGWREESAAHPLLERLVTMVDLTSRA